MNSRPSAGQGDSLGMRCPVRTVDSGLLMNAGKNNLSWSLGKKVKGGNNSG